MNIKSPFRYPGGKFKIVDSILSKIEDEMGKRTVFSKSRMNTFVDVFAGGGSVALGVMNVYPSATIIMNDMDEWIYAFWQSLTIPIEYKRMMCYIDKYKNPTIKDFLFLRKSITRRGLKVGYKGFLAWFFNRTTFSGIFSSGPIGGMDQSGNYKIDCRYNPEKAKELIGNIRKSFEKRNVEVLKEDFRVVLKRYMDAENVMLYLDPPYMKQGHQLYHVHMQENDYVDMAEMLKQCKCKWMVSHDDFVPFVKLFSGWAKIKSIEGVAYTINSIEGKRKTELLITQ